MNQGSNFSTEQYIFHTSLVTDHSPSKLYMCVQSINFILQTKKGMIIILFGFLDNALFKESYFYFKLITYSKKLWLFIPEFYELETCIFCLEIVGGLLEWKTGELSKTYSLRELRSLDNVLIRKFYINI